MTARLTVTAAGPHATVQDLGRPGWLATGVAPSGAFDHHSLRWANHLVGEDPGDRYLVGRNPGTAGIEALLGGLRCTLDADRTVAVTGAEAEIEVGDRPQAQWEAFMLPAGAELSIGTTRGARAYLAVAGGIAVPEALGSRATHARARLGGHEGRTLEAGDELALGTPREHTFTFRHVPARLRPIVAPPWTLGVVLGPQDELFTPESVECFLTDEWRLSILADRMGCRFEGPRLEFRERTEQLARQAGSDPSNIVDDVTPLGGIQVPSGVEAIAMGVDFPSIGGYAKIATVISAHIPRLGQMRPGDVARFRELSTDQAVHELRASLLPAAAINPIATPRTT